MANRNTMIIAFVIELVVLMSVVTEVLGSGGVFQTTLTSFCNSGLPLASLFNPDGFILLIIVGGLVALVVYQATRIFGSNK